MKPKPRMPSHKVSPKNKHQWGKSLASDFDRLMGGNGNQGKRKK